MRAKCKAFSLIELLIVVAIIGILAGLIVFAIGRVSNQARGNSTRTILANLTSMLQEYRLAKHNDLTALPATPVQSPQSVVEYTDWKSSGSPNVNDRKGDHGKPKLTDAVPQTRKVIKDFMAVTPVREMIAKLPAERVVTFADTTGSQLDDVPIVLDAWNNPIIFVPSGGLMNVKVNSLNKNLKSPEYRPFFASAGPDGNFTTGDDNIYSFEN